ncbi:MAG: hypothetical protein C5B50_12750 [Verrucomicrobia bacterium]|nr:MAG: hypothetical protein C5B50_12750 [Verrucomicrobiota bacterium]
MNPKIKRLLFIALPVAVVGIAALLLVNWFNNREPVLRAPTDKERAQISARLHPGIPQTLAVVPQKPISASQAVRLAIGSLGLESENENRQVADILAAELAGVKGLALVERRELDKVLRELELSFSGLVRPKQIVRAGKLLRADWFVFGTSASVDGTNRMIVARVVDARTGVMRDIDVFKAPRSAIKLASDMRDFVRQCREGASKPKPKVFLALGAFEDVSINSRQVGFPDQLRAYLTGAYRSGRVTMLERESVEALLSEVRLDLAGLTDEGAARAPSPMQSAFWIVTGHYQSYERAGFEVELDLKIQRIFGNRSEARFRDRPGETLFKKIKNAIDEVVTKESGPLIVSRSSEARFQLSAGKDLLDLPLSDPAFIPIENLNPEAASRSARNTQEAFRAFQTVLLLEPTNREVKLYLAACLRTWTMNRVAEARDYYREVLDEPVQDQWTAKARSALLDSFFRYSPEEKARWFQVASKTSTNSAAAQFYQQMAKGAAEDAVIAAGDSSKGPQVAEPRLIEGIRNWKRSGIWDFQNSALGRYADSFGTNRAAAAKRLVELLPRLQQENPELAPHILAGVATFQVDTNAPIIREFERSLNECAEHPDSTPEARFYFTLIGSPVRYWAQEHKLYGLLAKSLEAVDRAASKKKAFPLDSDQKMALAYAYMAAESWTNALRAFETFSNRPVEVGNGGPYGEAFTVIFTADQTALCRQKMGLPTIPDPRRFRLNDACLCLHVPSAFVADADGLWVGMPNRLMHLDFGLQTNLLVQFPEESWAPVTSLCVSSSNIWISTEGAGLIELDRSTKRSRRISEADGLLMDSITAVALGNQVLWIGYGSGPKGGLGMIDLANRKVTNFTRSLFGQDSGTALGSHAGTDESGNPTSGLVGTVFPVRDEDVWFGGMYRGLHRYRIQGKAWDDFPDAGPCSSFILDGDRLFVGQSLDPIGYLPNRPAVLGVTIYNLSDQKWQVVSATEGLPHVMVTALALDGSDLWVGGTGFLAAVDLRSSQVRKLAYIPARNVNRLQVGGGYLWAQFNKHLFKLNLAEVR